MAIPGDLRDEKFCQELVGRAVEGLGGLDIVVSNAGRQQTRASILDVTTEDFDATMKTNIYAPFWIIKAALPHLKPGSVIIGTASEQAYDPSPHARGRATLRAFGRCAARFRGERTGPTMRLELALVLRQHRAPGTPRGIPGLFIFVLRLRRSHRGTDAKAQRDETKAHKRTPR